MIGIELTQWSPNGNDGSLNGEQYFNCDAGHGYFVELRHISSNVDAKNQTNEEKKDEDIKLEMGTKRRGSEVWMDEEAKAKATQKKHHRRESSMATPNIFAEMYDPVKVTQFRINLFILFIYLFMYL